MIPSNPMYSLAFSLIFSYFMLFGTCKHRSTKPTNRLYTLKKFKGDLKNLSKNAGWELEKKCVEITSHLLLSNDQNILEKLDNYQSKNLDVFLTCTSIVVEINYQTSGFGFYLTGQDNLRSISIGKATISMFMEEISTLGSTFRMLEMTHATIIVHNEDLIMNDHKLFTLIQRFDFILSLHIKWNEGKECSRIQAIPSILKNFILNFGYNLNSLTISNFKISFQFFRKLCKMNLKNLSLIGCNVKCEMATLVAQEPINLNDSYVCVYWRNCSLCYGNNYLPINSYSMTLFNHDLTRNLDSISSLQRPKYELITTLISNLNSLEKRKKFVFSGETNLISNLKTLPDNLMPDDLSIEMYSIQSTVFVLNMLNASLLKRLVLIVKPEGIISDVFNELYYYFQALETLEIRAYDFKLDFIYSVFLRCFTKCDVKILSITCQSLHESFGTVISQFLSLETLKLFIRKIYMYDFKQLLSNDKFSNSLFRLCISLEIDENGYIPFLNPFINLEELNIRVEKTRNDNNGNFCTLNLASKNRTFQQKFNCLSHILPILRYRLKFLRYENVYTFQILSLHLVSNHIILPRLEKIAIASSRSTCLIQAPLNLETENAIKKITRWFKKYKRLEVIIINQAATCGVNKAQRELEDIFEDHMKKIEIRNAWSDEYSETRMFIIFHR